MDKKDLYLNPEPIDNITDYGKGLEPKIDPRTDFGRGISYKTCDGKDVATMEEVMQYNQMFYERMMNNSEEKGMNR
jgi:hypothetical protein